ncbi:hypothetical protein QYE76_021357 [Lolium multiflorum]|uniref:Transposon protein, putative, CACTA, En/Spm sub-class n=1 Tax=Lolium multiflorum TaxID=4521 RepID=A0AAD8R6K9_LOLMU|nr:hypothetical protein QYE76_021357 [Lolium multiflorum]
MHLLRHGFMPSYNCWTKHGERGVIMEEDEEGDDIDESYLDHFGDTFMDDAEGGEGEGEGDQEEARDEPADDLGRTIADARSRCETEKERENLDRMLEDHKKSLYPGCDNGLKKLGCTLDLLRWKAQEGVADSGFEKLLKMLKNMFPKNNELPSSTYEAKKVVCPLGLEVLKIHACINDCILYRGEYENLNECPVCTALRYKIRGDDPGDDVEGQKPRKKVPAKPSANRKTLLSPHGFLLFLRFLWPVSPVLLLQRTRAGSRSDGHLRSPRPEYWDARDWDSSNESEDDEPLTDGEENLQFLVDGELETPSDDDLFPWEGSFSSDEEEEEKEDADDDSLEGYPPAKRLRMWWDDDDSDDEEEDEAPAEGYGSSDEEPAGSGADEGSEDDDEGSDGP